MTLISLISFLFSIWCFYDCFNKKTTSSVKHFRFILFLMGLILFSTGVYFL